MSDARRNLAAVATNYLRFAVGMAVVFAVTPIAVRHLGAHGFGLWTLAVASIGLIGLLEAGIATTAVRFAGTAEGAGDVVARNRYLATLAAVAMPLGCLILGVAWIGAPSLASLLGLEPAEAATFTLLVRVGGAAVGLGLPAGIWRAALVARGDLPVTNLIEIIAVLAGAAVTVAGLTLGWGAAAMVAGFSVTTLAPALAYVPIAYRRCQSLSVSRQHASASTLREIRSFAGAATAANTANVAALRCEPMLVKAFLPITTVAHYSVAARIAEYLLLLGKQFSSALTPAIARAHGAGNPDAIRRVLLGGTGMLFALTALGASIAGLQAPDLLAVWLGQEFTDAAPALRWLLGAAVVSSLSMNAANALGMTGRHRLVAVSCTAAALLRLGGGALLLPRFGLEGPGIAAIIAAASLEIGLVLRRACRLFDIRALEFFRIALMPGLAGLVALWLAAAGLRGLIDTSGWGGIALQSALLTAAFAAVGIPLVGGLRLQLPGARVRGARTALSAAART